MISLDVDRDKLVVLMDFVKYIFKKNFLLPFRCVVKVRNMIYKILVLTVFSLAERYILTIKCKDKKLSPLLSAKHLKLGKLKCLKSSLKKHNFALTN